MARHEHMHGGRHGPSYPAWDEKPWRLHESPGQAWNGHLLEWALMRFLGRDASRSRFWWGWVALFRLQCSFDTSHNDIGRGLPSVATWIEHYEHTCLVVCQLSRVSKLFWLWLGRVQCCGCGVARPLRAFHWRWSDDVYIDSRLELGANQYHCYPCRDCHHGVENGTLNQHPLCRNCWTAPLPPDSDD